MFMCGSCYCWISIHFYIGGGKGGAMGLQPHLIFKCSIGFYFSCLSISPTWFDYLPPLIHFYMLAGNLNVVDST